MVVTFQEFKNTIVNTIATQNVGLTSGCFDLLHKTQIHYLNKCKEQCDFLIVLVDSDDLCYSHKNKKPVINELDRAYTLSNLKAVDCVIVMNNLNMLTNICESIFLRTRKLTTVFKHYHKIYNNDLIKILGNYVIIEDINSFSSTTEIVNFIKNNNNESKNRRQTRKSRC